MGGGGEGGGAWRELQPEASIKEEEEEEEEEVGKNGSCDMVWKTERIYPGGFFCMNGFIYGSPETNTNEHSFIGSTCTALGAAPCLAPLPVACKDPGKEKGLAEGRGPQPSHIPELKPPGMATFCLVVFTH